MDKLELVDIRKTFLKYFVNDIDEIKDKGIVKTKIRIEQFEIEDENGNKLLNPQICNIHLDLIFLNSEFELEKEVKEEFEDEETLARLQLIMKTIINVETEHKIETEEFNRKILSMAEPYIRKDIRDFCDEIELPKFSLPLMFWE